MSRIAHIITESRNLRAKTSLKTWHRGVKRRRNRAMGYRTVLTAAILVLVLAIALLYAYRAYFSPV
jgi:hypothetical protein